MRKLVLILIALIAAVTFIRSLDVSLNAEENGDNFKSASLDLTTR
jgi:hypothetical protein